jgi:tetratricopeptide (TPR) repeat protein
MILAEIEQICRTATEQQRAGRLGEAETSYRQVLAADPQRHEALGALAQIAFMTGRGGEAAALLRLAVVNYPGSMEYRGNLGMVLSALGRFDEALDVFRDALAMRGDSPEIWNNFGGALKETKRLDEAEQAFRRALALKPGYADALSNLGVVLKDQDKQEEAIDAFSRAIKLRPQNGKTYVNLGSALLKKERFAESAEAYRGALAREPGNADALFGLGSALHGREQFREAMAEYRAAIGARPNFPDAYCSLGRAAHKLGEREEAIAHFRRAAELRPGLTEAVNNLGLILHDLGRDDEALEVLEGALRAKPDVGETHHILANVLQQMGRMEEALAAYRWALELQPDSDETKWNMSLALLGIGRLREGWGDYELRRKTQKVSKMEPPAGPAWKGENLGGRTILLHAEQGFGDMIQFVRYVPMVRERGGRVIVLCPRSLHRLLSRGLGIEAFVGGGDVMPGYEVQCSLLSLPGVFETSIETIPNQVPYLFSEAEAVERWRERLARAPGKLKVGLSWAGNPEHRNDGNRSVPLAGLAPLRDGGDITFLSLQKGPGAEKAAAPPAGMRIIDWTSELADFAETAAMVANLDLVISVDTAVAHLCGAMGKPVWVMLPTPADWRWMMGRTDSPWYPTARLFRQERRGEWAGCIGRVAEALRGVSAEC